MAKSFLKAVIQDPLGVAFRLGQIGVWTARHGVSTAAEKFRYAAHDVAYFSPPAPPAPHWQDLVFGDGRAESLLKRLEGTPHVTITDQKKLMEQSGGLDVLPQNIDLVKYGLNDAIINNMVSGLWHTILEAYREQGRWKTTPDTVIIDPERGLIDPESQMPLYDEFGYMACTDSASHWVLSAQYETAIDEMDDRTAAAMTRPYPVERIERAVLDWAVREVLPAIPYMVMDYVARPQPDGRILLNTADSKSLLHIGQSPEYYLALRRDYNGTLPDYDGQIMTTSALAPQKPGP